MYLGRWAWLEQSEWEEIKSDRKWGADPVGPVSNYKVSEDRGRVLSRVECSSHLIVNRKPVDTCDTCTFTSWGSSSEMEFSMQDITDPSESTPVEVWGRKQEWE